jgi:galactonate dehydratase
MRALSAIDLALWDLLGKSLGAPVYRLIGGKANPRARLYNTCFPYKYDFNRVESSGGGAADERKGVVAQVP